MAREPRKTIFDGRADGVENLIIYVLREEFIDSSCIVHIDEYIEDGYPKWKWVTTSISPCDFDTSKSLMDIVTGGEYSEWLISNGEVWENLMTKEESI